MVLAFERLRYADDQPLAVMRNWIPKGLVELDAEQLERTGLYQLIRAGGSRCTTPPRPSAPGRPPPPRRGCSTAARASRS